MSKLKFVFSTFFAISSLAGIYFFCKSSPEIAFANSKHTESAPEVWGKPNAPVLVKVQELNKTGSIVELRGMIRSKFSNLNIEWKLPEGAHLVSGELNKTVTKNTDGSFTQETIRVDVGTAKDEPIVFVAYVEQNGERIGHSRIYKWNVPTEHLETVEKVRAQMKARKSKFVP